jgi:uncharacterized membrane protein (DUF4010 family)
MPDSLATLFQQFGLSVLLGLLVGLQREHVASKLGGLRTFPLITVLGTLCSLLAESFGGWIVAAGLLGVVALAAIGNAAKLRVETPSPGLTTEAAMLLMFTVGAYLAVGPAVVAIVVAGGVAVLLQFKLQLHGLVQRLGQSDVQAIMRFVLIACIILPVLPDQVYGPYEVLNPFEMWLMVVLIVGISLSGYLAYKFFGPDAGMLVGGLIGGAISSTATTVSYARRVSRQAGGVAPAALVILIATAVVYVRVLVEIWFMAPAYLSTAAPPILVLMSLAVVPGLLGWLRVRTMPYQAGEQESPADFQAAVLFALLYLAVLYGLALAKNYLGTKGLFLVASLSGLTDMDAITLSSARMVARSEIAPGIGWRLIVTAALANLVFKLGIVALLGPRRLLLVIAALFSISFLGGAALIFLWP